MTKKLYSICNHTGSIVKDACGNSEVFYLTSDPRLLRKHCEKGEKVKTVSPSVLMKTWILRDGISPVRVKRGVMLAADTKTSAQLAAVSIGLKAEPVKLVG